MKLKTLACSALLLASTTASADVMVHDAYARATPPNAVNSAIFMHLMNKEDTARQIIDAQSNAADVVELHNHIMTDGMMQMRKVNSIDIPANGIAELKPGGMHIMLLGLKGDLQEGEAIKLTLKFANGEEKELSVPVKKVMAGMKKTHAHTTKTKTQ
ncbi:copper chaperone PCu(A)C [Photobacterium kagoshimensis]|uniref:copper chaperone PCu(A)C n=1 Tax=Photobacterium kagoshimensis TaxID=2910242 RepID=UPI003D116749